MDGHDQLLKGLLIVANYYSMREVHKTHKNKKSSKPISCNVEEKRTDKLSVKNENTVYYVASEISEAMLEF